MSNGIGKNPLNDISKVYLEQVGKKKKKKDDSYLETDMKKRQENNEKARKDMEKMGTSMKNPHFEQKQFGWDSVNSMTKAYKDMQEGIRDEDPEKGTAERKARLEKKRGMKMDDHPQYTKEALDPVGKEDGDVDNDGDKDSSDKYLLKRRKAIGKAMKKRMSEGKYSSSVRATYGGKTETFPVEVYKKKTKPVQVKTAEEFSNWRGDLTEIMTDTEDEKQIKEKSGIKNKVKINPKLGEAIEEIGGTLLEEIEIDEMDYVIESVYDELIEEGYSQDEVEYGIDTALNTIEEGYYDSAVAASKAAAAKNRGETPKRSMKDRLKSAAKKAIMGTARAAGRAMKAKAKVQAAPGRAKAKVRSIADRVKSAAKAGYAQGRGPVEKKSKTAYRGAGVGRKEKLGEESVSEAVKGQDTESRKEAAAERKRGDKRLSPSKGKGYADQQKQSISYMDKLTKKNKNVVGLVTKEDVEQVDEANAGPSTPVKSYDGKIMPNYGGGRIGKIKLKPGVAPVRTADSFEPEGDQIDEFNIIQKAMDVVDKVNRTNQKKVDMINKIRPGSASMPKHGYFSKPAGMQNQSFEPEGEQIDEKINMKKADMGDVVKDFYKSKAPQFKGKSKEKRREMAIAAKLTAERGGKRLGEQQQQQDPSQRSMIGKMTQLQMKKQQMDRRKLQMKKRGEIPMNTESVES